MSNDNQLTAMLPYEYLDACFFASLYINEDYFCFGNTIDVQGFANRDEVYSLKDVAQIILN